MSSRLTSLKIMNFNSKSMLITIELHLKRTLEIIVRIELLNLLWEQENNKALHLPEKILLKIKKLKNLLKMNQNQNNKQTLECNLQQLNLFPNLNLKMKMLLQKIKNQNLLQKSSKQKSQLLDKGLKKLHQ